MGPQSALSSSTALEGVHGVQVVPHAPFIVEEVTQHGDRRSTCKKSHTRNNRHLLMERVQQHIAFRFKPVHCCLTGDQNLAETVANVITSFPFIALGVQTPRQVPQPLFMVSSVQKWALQCLFLFVCMWCRKTLKSKLYANSLIGVGVASSLYHSSRGRVRKFMRWVDYTMIATATVIWACIFNRPFIQKTLT